MNLTDRLRGVLRSGGSASQDPAYVHVRRPGAADSESVSADPANREAVADILGGEWREWHGQRYLVIDRRYPPGHRHGRLAIVDGAPDAGGWPTLSILEPSVASGRVLFIDLETTGLTGGAGTYAFLVGCAWFEGTAFRIRQFLLTGFGAERGLLEEVALTARGTGALATYNGKTFDLPLIETRFSFHRMTTPFTGMPHVDMLHPARRLWRSAGGSASPNPPYARARRSGSAKREFSSADPTNAARQASCRLAMVEGTVLGHVRDGDVPGFEIPSRYFEYVRSGDPRPLEAVLAHNRLDLLSLAMLTATAARLLVEGASAARTPCEALGLGRLYERRGMLTDARACFARAAGIEGNDLEDAVTRAEALRAYAVLSRRAGRYDDAESAWRRLLDLRPCPPHLAREASEALAVHHEHRRRDLQVARHFALQSLQFSAGITRMQAVQHRLARIDRKLGRLTFG